MPIIGGEKRRHVAPLHFAMIGSLGVMGRGVVGLASWLALLGLEAAEAGCSYQSF